MPYDNFTKITDTIIRTSKQSERSGETVGLVLVALTVSLILLTSDVSALFEVGQVKPRVFELRHHLIIQPLRTVFFDIGDGGRFTSGVSGTLLELPELDLIFQC